MMSVGGSASYRSPGKIIFSAALAPILTATYMQSQLKRTVTSVAQLMGLVNDRTTSAVPRSVNPKRNRPCSPTAVPGSVLSHRFPAPHREPAVSSMRTLTRHATAAIHPARRRPEPLTSGKFHFDVSPVDNGTPKPVPHPLEETPRGRARRTPGPSRLTQAAHPRRTRDP
jgi:hypothetical protein